MDLSAQPKQYSSENAVLRTLFIGSIIQTAEKIS